MGPIDQGIPQPEPGGKEALDKYQSQLSTEYPGDSTMMAELSGLDPNSTVRELMGKMGIDVDGPITQLTSFANKQEALADPMNKMKAMGAGPGPRAPGGNQPPQGQPPPAQPQAMPSNPMDSLMR